SEPKAPQFVPSFAQSSKHVKSPRHTVQQIETTIPATTPAPAMLAQSKPVSNTVVRPVSAALPNITVTRPRHAYHVVTKFKSPIRRHITRSPSSKTSNSPPRVTTVQALVGNPKQALKDKGVIDSGCLRHMTGNMSYLYEFEELNGGYVAFRGNPRVIRLLNRVLVTKPHNKTPNELLHGRTPSIGFMRPFGCLVTILNTLDPLGKFQGKVDEGFLVGYSICSKAFRVFNSRTRIIQETLHVHFLENKPNVAGDQTNSSAGFQDKFDVEKAGEEVDQTYMLFPVWSAGSINPQNNDEDATFDGKERDFDAKKPESEVILSSSSSAQSRKQDDKTKKEAKGKSPVESVTGYRDLNAEFEDCSDNSSNEINAASSIVHNVGQNSLNNTNTFSATGPSNTAISPTYGKSSFIDASQLPDGPDMPELEDITYSDDEDVVGAEADFNNLEYSIPVSPIPTTRIHKDHPISQIIGDMSSTTQTRSMTRAVKDQGRLTQMFDNDFHTCMFACFLSQKEPKRVHQALKDPSWIEANQEELL
nr:retrovirus-related Pol polyprotein from transposon TNT 1-94 [Tanacetum cinerariifolium]